MASTISVPVDEQTARAFAAASPEQQRKIQILLRLRLKELTETPARPLETIMDEIGHKAEGLGLTPEILESFLNGE